MLATVELPGIYVQPDSGLLCVFGHLEVQLLKTEGDTATLECHNPTDFDAEVRVFAEQSVAAGTILGQAAALRWPTFAVPVRETQKLTVKVQEQLRKE